MYIKSPIDCSKVKTLPCKHKCGGTIRYRSYNIFDCDWCGQSYKYDDKKQTMHYYNYAPQVNKLPSKEKLKIINEKINKKLDKIALDRTLNNPSKETTDENK